MVFAIIQRQALRRGDVTSVEELVAAIGQFCDGWNQRCQPFAWTKDADQILTKFGQQPPRPTRSSHSPERQVGSAHGSAVGPAAMLWPMENFAAAQFAALPLDEVGEVLPLSADRWLVHRRSMADEPRR